MYKDFCKEKEFVKEIIEKYSNVLPDELISVWKQYGTGSFMNGFLKIINPDEYMDLLKETFSDYEGVIPVMVTAFGDIITVNEEERVDIIYYRYGYFSVIATSWEMFEIFAMDDFMNDRMFKNGLYKTAIEKIGEIEYDECLGYVPLLALGGSEKVDNLKKIKIKEHIRLISDMVGIVTDIESMVD